MKKQMYIYKRSKPVCLWGFAWTDGWHNMPCFRSPARFKQYAVDKAMIDELRKEWSCLKRITGEHINARDPHSDIYLAARFEAKSWKRSSKRRNQYK